MTLFSALRYTKMLASANLGADINQMFVSLKVFLLKINISIKRKREKPLQDRLTVKPKHRFYI